MLFINKTLLKMMYFIHNTIHKVIDNCIAILYRQLVNIVANQ